MPENIFEHTTSIVGLTCKPLAILSETISPQEMSRVRGGNHHIDEPPETGPPPGTECPPGCPDYCCDPRDIVITNPNPEGPQNRLPPLGSPSPQSGSIFTIRFGGVDTTSSPADSSSVDSSVSADSSGTQDQNGGALDNVEEEDYYDWIDPDDEEDWEDFIDEWDSEEGSSGYEGFDTPEEMFF